MTAEHMVRSKTVSAHVAQGVEVDFSSVDKVRIEKGGAWRAREGFFAHVFTLHRAGSL